MTAFLVLAVALQMADPLSWISLHADQVGWALASILLVEMVRDFYHFLGHHVPPLQRLHNWHHRAYKKDFTPISPELYRQAQLYNDAPESLFMIVVMSIAAFISHTWGLWIGVLYAVGFLAAALLRSQGLLTATDLTHEPGPLTTRPGHWKVNPSAIKF
jgi:monoglucosyldiacylglycerol epimerase